MATLLEKDANAQNSEFVTKVRTAVIQRSWTLINIPSPSPEQEAQLPFAHRVANDPQGSWVTRFAYALAVEDELSNTTADATIEGNVNTYYEGFALNQ